MQTLILFVIMLLVLVIPHEAGHLIMAKICGVYVEEFSVGMGPRLFARQIGETQYTLRLLPLGGYCKMLSGDEEGTNPNDSRAFNNKSAAQKLAILCAGIVMNVLIAWVLITGILASVGVATNVLSDVVKDSPAYEAGLRAGDKVTAVNGHKSRMWSDTMQELSLISDGDVVEITVDRDNASKTFYMNPVYDEKNERYIVGIACSVSRNPIDVFVGGVNSTVSMNSQILQAFKTIITGQADKDAVGGPVKIYQVVDQTKSYGLKSYLSLIAMISLNLAIINTLPIPSLDGARMLFVILRKLSGDRLSYDKENIVHFMGMFFLLMLFVMITANDIIGLL